MENARETWIVHRIPGFYAAVERSALPEEERPVVVVAGTGSRALIVSAEPAAARFGARPGRRIGAPDSGRLCVVPATPEKYRHGQKAVVACLRRELPEVHPARPGVFGGRWSGGDRFLPDALERARRQLAPLRLPGGWGIGAGAAAAEIAAARSRAGELVRIERGNERPFLADLPLALLPDLDDAQCDALAEVGVRTFRDAAALPEAVLRSLLGPDGPALRRIALTGRRPPTAPGWRERRRLAEDEDDPAAVRSAVADLVAQALAGAEAAERSPGPLALTLVYADRRRSSGRIPPSGRRHEGHWQRAAMKLVMELWTRRVRIAEVRVSLRYGPPPSHQLQLFVPPHRQEREGRLAGAVSRVRGRWGTSTLHFAAAHIVPENGERGRAS